MPPCTSFEERELVPLDQSRASTIPTLSPRVAASSAAPGADDAAAHHEDVELFALQRLDRGFTLFGAQLRGPGHTVRFGHCQALLRLAENR